MAVRAHLCTAVVQHCTLKSGEDRVVHTAVKSCNISTSQWSHCPVIVYITRDHTLTAWLPLGFFCVVGGRFWLGADGAPVMDVGLPAPTVNLHQTKLGILLELSSPWSPCGGLPCQQHCPTGKKKHTLSSTAAITLYTRLFPLFSSVNELPAIQTAFPRRCWNVVKEKKESLFF